MLDCTWNDLEAEIVLRNLGAPHEEQRRHRGYYLKLREECRKAMKSPESPDTDQTPELEVP